MTFQLKRIDTTIPEWELKELDNLCEELDFSRSALLRRIVGHYLSEERYIKKEARKCQLK